MTFKNYMTEKRSSSLEIFKLMKTFNIPITPKSWEKIFGVKEQYCFQSVKITRIDSLFKRQNKKNQVSTFVDFQDQKIFWGPEDLERLDTNGIVAVLKGKVTLQGEIDIYSDYTSDGRRWIDYGYLQGTKKTKVLEYLKLVRNDIIYQFEKYLKDSMYESLITVYHSGITSLEINYGELNSKDRQEVIKKYFDITNKALEKYSFALEKEDLAGAYDEHLCYDYKVQEILITEENWWGDEKLNAAEGLKKDICKYTKKIRIVTTNELEKILKKYQKKNKGK